MGASLNLESVMVYLLMIAETLLTMGAGVLYYTYHPVWGSLTLIAGAIVGGTAMAARR